MRYFCVFNMKPFGLYSVSKWFAGVYTSIKSTKIKCIPILMFKKIYNYINCTDLNTILQFCSPTT